MSAEKIQQILRRLQSHDQRYFVSDKYRSRFEDEIWYCEPEKSDNLQELFDKITFHLDHTDMIDLFWRKLAVDLLYHEATEGMYDGWDYDGDGHFDGNAAHGLAGILIDLEDAVCPKSQDKAL